MKTISITAVPGFEEWRNAARECLQAGIPPRDIIWSEGAPAQTDLFAPPPLQPQSAGGKESAPLSVSKAFLDIAQTVCCHKDADKYALLYRLLWRINTENKYLLKHLTDDDVMRAQGMVKAVRRDAYKITAFLRFRSVMMEGEEYFIAWYEPEHYTLERVLGFFQTRFKNMRWSILTPYRAAHWNLTDMLLEDNPDPSAFPKDDKIEQYWLGYYASIFNPARLKKSAMMSQMPRKYWKTMPETVLIQDLLRGSGEKVRAMIAASHSD